MKNRILFLSGEKATKILLFLAYSAFLVFLIYRSFLSVELTDEVYGIASIYSIYQGQRPIMTSWNLSTGWFIQVPLFALYAAICPDLEGIMLFFRLIYILFTGLNLMLISYLLYRFWQDRMVFFYIFPAMYYVAFSVFSVSYNVFMCDILLLVATLLFTSKKEKAEKMHYFIMGILMCCGCMAYPTLIVTAVILTILIFYINKGSFQGLKVIWYVAGGVVTAAAFLLWIFSEGSMEIFGSAVSSMLSSPHEKSKGIIDAEFLVDVFYKPFRTYLSHMSAKLLWLYLLFNILISCIAKKKKQLWNGIGLVSFLAVNAYVTRNISGYMVAGEWLALMIFIIFSDRKPWKKYAVFFFMFFAYMLTYCFTSDNRNVFTAFVAAGQIVFLLMGLVLYDNEILPHRCVALAAMLVMAISGLTGVYTYVYRDEPVGQLTAKVEEGIYKGLYTIQNRKQFVEKTERMLKEQISTQDSICAVTRMPMVYLMANAEICAPTTWDAQYLSRGYISAAPLLDYFESMQEIPDVLVAMDMDIADFYENPKYEINEFIDEYYQMYYMEKIEGVTFYLWRKRNNSGVNFNDRFSGG